MQRTGLTLLTHGGAGSKNEYADGSMRAATAGVKLWQSGASLTDAMCCAVVELENDPRFNAGIGSHARSDGVMQMDAAMMTSLGQFGAVSCVEGFKNPIAIARAVSESEYNLLCGRGAEQFARDRKCEPYPADAPTNTSMDFSNKDNEDTVGCVAFDGDLFVAGLSTGGTHQSHPGRVGDVPLIGCGLYAGTEGAIACTGSGEAITLQMTAYRAYQLALAGKSPQAILETALGWFDADDAFGVILITREGSAGGANRSMAWSSVRV